MIAEEAIELALHTSMTQEEAFMFLQLLECWRIERRLSYEEADAIQKRVVENVHGLNPLVAICKMEEETRYLNGDIAAHVVTMDEATFLTLVEEASK